VFQTLGIITLYDLTCYFKKVFLDNKRVVSGLLGS